MKPAVGPKTRGRIVKTAGVCGGDARIRQTRIAVWLLAEIRQMGVADDAILASYPDLSAEDLQAAWEYAAKGGRVAQGNPAVAG